jgi:hypothetical protein
LRCPSYTNGLLTVGAPVVVIVGQRLYYGAGESKSDAADDEGELDVERAGIRESGTPEESRGLTADAER